MTVSGRVGRNQTTSPRLVEDQRPSLSRARGGRQKQAAIRSLPSAGRSAAAAAGQGGSGNGGCRSVTVTSRRPRPPLRGDPRSTPAPPSKTSPRAPPDTRRTKSARVVRSSPMGESASTSDRRCCDLGEIGRSNHDRGPRARWSGPRRARASLGVFVGASVSLEIGGRSTVLGEEVDDRCADHRGEMGREAPLEIVELVRARRLRRESSPSSHQRTRTTRHCAPGLCALRSPRFRHHQRASTASYLGVGLPTARIEMLDVLAGVTGLANDPV